MNSLVLQSIITVQYWALKELQNQNLYSYVKEQTATYIYSPSPTHVDPLKILQPSSRAGKLVWPEICVVAKHESIITFLAKQLHY